MLMDTEKRRTDVHQCTGMELMSAETDDVSSALRLLTFG